MPWIAAALAARFVVSPFFFVARFIIYVISCGSAHLIPPVFVSSGPEGKGEGGYEVLVVVRT